MACTYPSIHFSLDEDTLEKRSVVVCCVCGVYLCVFLCCFSLFLSILFILSLSLSLFLSSLFFPLFLSSSLLFLFSFSLLFSPPHTMERTDQPTRWRRASAQQSVLSLLLFPPSSLLSLPSSKNLLFHHCWKV